ncbi:DUF354 domain-containing protein [Methanosarcina sp. UBA411]|uniref:DUF354 domain-containing protein n=2 Tax=unclassified Methanosarcina TaxID=2644672 RepID=UPI0032E50812
MCLNILGEIMRIVICMNHPGHVHLFKNFIWSMRKRGHEIIIAATEKDVSFKLLDNYDFNYINLGSYGTSLMQKLVNLPIIDLRLYKEVKKFGPDIFVGMGSILAAHVSFLLRKKCVIFEDTEHSTEQIRLYLPFTDVVCTPSCFKDNLGKKQVRYNGYHELAYLHPNYFTPNSNVLRELGLKENDVFIILRFVSWNATHDHGHTGLTFEDKRNAVNELSKYGRVFITSEKPLQKEFEKYRITVSPEKIHDLLYYATLLYGESATMASECAVLGTHAIFCDYAGRGYTDEEEKYTLVYNFHDENTMGKDSLVKASELLNDPNIKQKSREKSKKLISEKIDVTKYMVEFVEKYNNT